MSVVPFSIRAPTRTNENNTEPLIYPTTETGWMDRYQWLHDAYVSNPYSVEDQRGWRLFRAFDESGKLMAETGRFTTDYQFVVTQDAGALFGGRIALETQATNMPPAVLEVGERVWRRSKMGQRLGVNARSLASMGRIGLEVMRTSPQSVDGGRPVIVAHDPRNYVVIYDKTGLHIERVIITVRYLDEDQIDDDGNADDAAMHVYRRDIDREGVVATLDGKEVPSETGEHLLGAVPFVNLLWEEYREPEHGLHAAHGMERGISLLDSLMTQIQAVGNRYGDPKLVGIGCKFGADSDVAQFGRQISGIPIGGSVEYLESRLDQIRSLLDAVKSFNAMSRETFPEFGIFGGGANASGEALKYRAAAFVSKIEDVRARVFPGIASALAMAEAMTRRAAVDLDETPYRIEAGPVLPIDVDAELKRINEIKMQGGFRLGDYTRHLQRLGMVGVEHEPNDYEIAAADQASDRALSMLTGGSTADDATTDTTQE